MSGFVVRTIGTFGNILWFVLAGFWLGTAYLATGLAWCITIIGIPFGVQCFKLSRYSYWPFGKAVITEPGGHGPLGFIGNILWVALSGLWLAFAHVVTGCVLCITIVGIPLGLANFKLARLALWPFGSHIVPADVANAFEA